MESSLETNPGALHYKQAAWLKTDALFAASPCSHLKLNHVHLLDHLANVPHVSNIFHCRTSQQLVTKGSFKLGVAKSPSQEKQGSLSVREGRCPVNSNNRSDVQALNKTPLRKSSGHCCSCHPPHSPSIGGHRGEQWAVGASDPKPCDHVCTD
eukprot:6462789-Amphidinium_carterae.1